MYILNTSFHVAEHRAAEFERWVRRQYIPAAEATGFLASPKFTRLLIEVEPSTVSYAVHFQCGSLDEAQRWHDNEAASLKDALHRATGGEVLFFTTFMEEMDHSCDI
ncbi:MAG: DUF4286 family protein [Muribaculaceae bacterium]|nr:DUF4286 family protein [Muribaculaceae bacterium]